MEFLCKVSANSIRSTYDGGVFCSSTRLSSSVSPSGFMLVPGFSSASFLAPTKAARNRTFRFQTLTEAALPALPLSSAIPFCFLHSNKFLATSVVLASSSCAAVVIFIVARYSLTSFDKTTSNGSSNSVVPFLFFLRQGCLFSTRLSRLLSLSEFVCCDGWGRFRFPIGGIRSLVAAPAEARALALSWALVCDEWGRFRFPIGGIRSLAAATAQARALALAWALI